MKLLVDGNIKDLTIIDIKTGTEYTQDLIGNSNGFDSFDEEKEMYVMSGYSYDWWDRYLKIETDLCNDIYDLRATLNDADKYRLNNLLINASDPDFESMQSKMKLAVDQFKSR